jgi:hypothetical protein
LAPLADEPFNAMKSDLKLLEYAALDLPVVASAVGPYRDAARALALHADGLEMWVNAVSDCLKQAPRDEARAAEVAARTMSRRSLDRWLALVVGQPWRSPSR